MGKWCEVKCNCLNRDPLPGSEIFDEPYRKRKRLTIQEQIDYTSEYLALSQDKVILWQLEIEQLQYHLCQEEYMGWHQHQILNEYLNNQTLLQDLVQTILGDGLALCAASEKTGNPVEFFW